MKCVCGYEYREGMIGASPYGEVWGPVLGDEDFIFCSSMHVEMLGQNIDVWACPKCGTIKLDVSGVC